MNAPRARAYVRTYVHTLHIHIVYIIYIYIYIRAHVRLHVTYVWCMHIACDMHAPARWHGAGGACHAGGAYI